MKGKKANQLTLELLNKKDSYGQSMLYLAIISKQAQKVESLLQYGVDINNVYKNKSALEVAFETLLANDKRSDVLLIIGYLLEANAVVNTSILYTAIQALNNTKESDLLFKLIKKCQSFDENNQFLLYWLVKYDCCAHSVFEAVLERVQELSQLKSVKVAVEKLPNFFSPAQKAAAFRQEVPHEFICPITQQKMIKPVTLEDGYSYEEEAIKKHLSIKKTSPMTNLELKNPQYHENRFLKNMIDAHKPTNKPLLQRSQSEPDLKDLKLFYS